MNKYDSTNDVDAILRHSTNSTIPPDVERRMDQHLATLRERLDEYEIARRARKENWIMNVFRITGFSRVRWAGIAAVAAVAIAIVIGLHPWGGGPSDVWAAAVERLHNARTLTCTVVEERNPGPIEMAYKDPGRFRITFSVAPMNGAVLVVDHTTKKALMLYPQAKMYDEMNGFSSNPGALRVIDDLRSLPDQASEALERREMDGRTVQGFRVADDVDIDRMKNVVVWVDVKTGDPVRLEGECVLADPNDPSGRKLWTARRVMSNFQFDVELDDSLFDVTPPEGYSVGPRTKSRVDRPSEKKD